MGAPSGRRNGRFKHGRYSIELRAERQAAAEAERAEETRRRREWEAAHRIDYAKHLRDIDDWIARNRGHNGE